MMIFRGLHIVFLVSFWLKYKTQPHKLKPKLLKIFKGTLNMFRNIENSATLVQYTGYLFSIDKGPKFPILLQHFERGSKLLNNKYFDTTHALSMSMDQIL